VDPLQSLCSVLDWTDAADAADADGSVLPCPLDKSYLIQGTISALNVRWSMLAGEQLLQQCLLQNRPNCSKVHKARVYFSVYR
jgi:hypothetical protein